MPSSLSRRTPSSSSTLKLSSSRPDFLSDNSDDDEQVNSLDPNANSYSDRLNSLLGREGDEGDGSDEEEADEFRYDGQDGVDEERAERTIAAWSNDEEKRGYDETLRDILGEEEQQAEEEGGGEAELEDFAVDRGVGIVRPVASRCLPSGSQELKADVCLSTYLQDNDDRSDRTPSTSSQRNGFSASFSPTSHGASPSGSLASSSKVQPSRRPPFLREYPSATPLRSRLALTISPCSLRPDRLSPPFPHAEPLLVLLHPDYKQLPHQRKRPTPTHGLCLLPLLSALTDNLLLDHLLSPPTALA